MKGRPIIEKAQNKDEMTFQIYIICIKGQFTQVVSLTWISVMQAVYPICPFKYVLFIEGGSEIGPDRQETCHEYLAQCLQITLQPQTEETK